MLLTVDVSFICLPLVFVVGNSVERCHDYRQTSIWKAQTTASPKLGHLHRIMLLLLPPSYRLSFHARSKQYRTSIPARRLLEYFLSSACLNPTSALRPFHYSTNKQKGKQWSLVSFQPSLVMKIQTTQYINPQIHPSFRHSPNTKRKIKIFITLSNLPKLTDRTSYPALRIRIGIQALFLLFDISNTITSLN
ncbi:hypothetical protein BKA61DRAFT_195990 [Leptodontidium sp. MPI-SDFR-AT-0119]|nr:hypothetical protein BKA61DRAFT_195990 [Leptodontidium sp. MPI-SDFR-AT-0119]